MNKNKKAQEEMVGFVLIVVLVTVILVILLGIMFYKTKNAGEVKSYQVENFVSAILGYSSECSTTRQKHLPLKRLISECLNEKKCLDGKDSCVVLNETITNLVGESWKTENRPVLGYRFAILGEDFEPMEFLGGNTTTRNSRVGIQNLMIDSRDFSVSLTIYG